jgi:hypothetical protein
VAQLDLKGQSKIVKPEKSPIPFMYLKQNLKNVFEQLCPRKVNVQSYDCTPIPVEILDLIALSKREGYFQEIQIWYDEKQPNPCCVGKTSEYIIYDGYVKGLPQSSYKDYKNKQEAIVEIKQHLPDFDIKGSIGWETDEKFYLLGKWADVRHSFDELKEMAKKRYVEEKGNDYRKQIKDAERRLIDLETEAFDKFN